MKRRRIASMDAPDVVEAPPTPFRLEEEMEVTTPVFGGSVLHDPGNPQLKPIDPLTHIRTAALRGQLREWWRRACGWHNGAPLPLTVLRRREAALWGWASTRDEPAKGWVSLAVSEHLSCNRVDVFEDGGRGRWVPKGNDLGLAYGTFPLSPENASTTRPVGTLHELRGTFDVRLEATPGRLSCAAWGPGASEAIIWGEVELAFRLWATFGGIGARTRRGFGAVAPTGGTDPDAHLQRLGWLYAVGPAKRDGAQALSFGLGRLRNFRQGVELGRNPGSEDPRRPGRSRWPEADAIRRITTMRLITKDRRHDPNHPVRAFPRAVFGMPINYKFTIEDKRNGDPRDTTLQPVGADGRARDRMASPLLLRPVKVNGRFVPYAIVLPTRVPIDDILRRLTIDGKEVRGTLSPDEQAQVSPLAHLRHGPDAGAMAVLKPFLEYFKESR